MDRSFAAAAEIVEQLDQMALAEKRTLSRPLAIRLMARDHAPAVENDAAADG